MYSNLEVNYKIIDDYFKRLKRRESIRDIFSDEAYIYSHKFGKLSVKDYENILNSQDQFEVDINIKFMIPIESVIIIHIELTFDKCLQREYVDVFEFTSENKVSRLYLNRISNKT